MQSNFYRLHHRVRALCDIEQFTTLSAGSVRNHIFSVPHVFKKCAGTPKRKPTVSAVFQSAEKKIRHAKRIPDIHL